VVLVFPEILSRCGTSAKLASILKNSQLVYKPWFQRTQPGYDWETLLITLDQACKAYCESVSIKSLLVPTNSAQVSTKSKLLSKRRPLDRISHVIKYLFYRNQQQDQGVNDYLAENELSNLK
jgi:hypothetical protein